LQKPNQSAGETSSRRAEWPLRVNSSLSAVYHL